MTASESSPRLDELPPGELPTIWTEQRPSTSATSALCVRVDSVRPLLNTSRLRVTVGEWTLSFPHQARRPVASPLSSNAFLGSGSHRQPNELALALTTE